MTQIDIVGVVTLGMCTALGGGIIRTPFSDLAAVNVQRLEVPDGVAAIGSSVAFVLGRRLERLATPIEIFDAPD